MIFDGFRNIFSKFAYVIVNSRILDRPINRVKVMLAEKQKSNKWLAEALGVAPTTVSKWCTNSAQPPMETFMQIAKLLEVDINELLRFEALPEIEAKG